MDARLAAAIVTHVGPSYLYPAHKTAPGVVNPDITQANIDQAICNPQWSTKSIRPPVSYTNSLKVRQLAASHATDKTENALHTEVCHGTLTLREARFIIATDWFKYYRDKVLK